MAQLPPKIPNMGPNWLDFPHQRIPSMGSLLPHSALGSATTTQNPSWVDEFLDYSSNKRGTHRRSASDSITFLEGNDNGNEFERFDDEQFMSMFTDDISAAMVPTASSSNPSSPSDVNSINDEKQKPSDHPQSQCDSDPLVTTTNTNSMMNNGDRISDPKRVKRILANRQSAQRSRVRKLQYISELERSVTNLQAEVLVLSPRVAFLDHQRLLLNVDNSALKQRIAALAQDKIFKDAHQEALKREIERLRQVYHQQSLKKIEYPSPPSQPSPDIKLSGEEEQQQQLITI